jgi:hypothetical protein
MVIKDVRKNGEKLLLISGLEVRVLPGSPLVFNELVAAAVFGGFQTVAETVAGLLHFCRLAQVVFPYVLARSLVPLRNHSQTSGQ